MRRYKIHSLAGSNAAELDALLKDDAQKEDVNLRDRNRTTPLHHAVYYNKAKCVKSLLDAGADVNAVDRDGSSPLHVACFIGALASVKSLIKSGAQVNAADLRGHTALHKACVNGNERVVQLLLQHGADLHAVDNSRRSALHIASCLGKAKALAALLEAGLNVELRDSNSATALHVAAHANQVQSVQALLSHNAQANAKDWAGRTPLHLAAAIGSEACTAVLLAPSESVDVLDDDRASPLHHAAFNGHSEVVQLLLQRGADPDLADTSGMTAFSKACFKGHRGVVELLLYDAKYRSVTLDHPTIRNGLITAAAGGSFDVCDLLLSQRVDPESKWEDGFTALTKASFFGHVHIVRHLVDMYKASIKGPHLHAAAHMGRVEIVDFLIKSGCDVSAKDSEGGSPLHSAAYNGHVTCCKKLIEAGSDLTLVDDRGWSPLHLAARTGHVEVLRLLLDEVVARSLTLADGADKQGMRVLHHAVGHPKCVELLIERKFALDCQDNKGLTALHRAVSMNKVPDAIALIRAGASLELRDSNNKGPLEIDNSMKEALADVLAERARLSNVHEYEKAVELFNEKPRKAIEFLVEAKLVREGEHKAADIAEFLTTAKGLDIQQIGEYISEPGDFGAQVTREFASRFRFIGQSLEQSLRSYLLAFRLPGEAQRIDRVMQAFASRFHHDNPDMFSHEDTAYVLAFSMIMLQTDAHNPAIKKEKKMTKQQFIQNNKGIDQERDLPEGMLSEIYDNIVSNPIKITNFLNNVETNGLLKLRSDKGRWGKFWVVLRENCLYYFMSEKDKQPQGIVPLENLAVRKTSALQFEISSPQSSGDERFVKACKMESGVIVPDNVLVFYFEAGAEQEADQWCAKIRSSIIGNPVRELMAQRRQQLQRLEQSTMQFSETASSHLGPQMQIALQMCAAAAKGEDQVMAEYPGSVVRDPHGMLRYYIITNEISKNKCVVLVSRLWRDMDECESWAQSPTSGKLLEMCRALRKNLKDEATQASPLSGYPYRNMARKAFEMLCDDLTNKEYGLFVVAHGVSGPLAPIIARALVRQKYKVRKVLTFGEPAIFTQRGVEKHAKLPYFRFTHHRDLVPCMFPGFLHAGTEIMVFSDSTVTIVPRNERDETKGLAVKVLASTFGRARQIVEMVAASNPGPQTKASGSGSLKGSSLAHLQKRLQTPNRPSFNSNQEVATEEVEKVVQDLIWEENRMQTYVGALKAPETLRVVLFDSKRNEL